MRANHSQISETIFVTKPSLPPIEEVIPHLEKIWNSRVLTNGGEYHVQLEQDLCKYLGVKYISLFTNGTLALLIALQALEIKGEVLTTPFSFIATTHALWWNGIKPIFVDIEASSCNIDVKKLEQSITKETTAILPVHVYGNPCEVHEIDRIAGKHGLKVLYDACHAFGVKLDKESILNFGDLSVLSFHATKIFNTFEGGAIISHSKEMKEKIDFLKNFGFADEVNIVSPGINAKMNEFQAMIGLLQLKHIDEAIIHRRKLIKTYKKMLGNIPGIRFLNVMPNVEHNNSYFPIFIDEAILGKSRDAIWIHLKENNIYSRRYFFPLISSFSPYSLLPSSNSEHLSVANIISNSVLCLPIYNDLEMKFVRKICEIILNYMR